MNFGDVIDYIHLFYMIKRRTVSKGSGCEYPESMNPTVQPEFHHIEHGSSYSWIVPVQIGLINSKKMQIWLPFRYASNTYSAKS
jgi:hypothetical protein